MAKVSNKAGSTVTVACKIPMGLVLRVFDMVPEREPVMGGGFREVTRAREFPKRAVINGFSYPQNAAPACAIVGGYALTPDVDRELWEKWLEQNKESDMVVNGLIFAHTTTSDATDQSKELEKTRSGLERLDPAALPRIGVETDVDHMKRQQKKAA